MRHFTKKLTVAVLAALLCIAGVLSFGLLSAGEAFAASGETTAVGGIQLRDASSKLLLFLSEHDYEGLATNDAAKTDVEGLNILDSILLFTSDSAGAEGIPLREAYEADGSASKTGEIFYNIWGENGCIAFDLDETVFTGASVCKITVLEGCQFPSFTEKDGCYTVTEAVTYINNDYQNEAAADMAVNWTKYEETFVYEEIAVGYSNSLHIRGEQLEDGNYECRILFLFEGNDYPSAAEKPNIEVGSPYSEYNFMEKVLLWTSEEEYITLGEAFHSVDGKTCIKNGVEQPRSQQIYYNLWGNNCFALDLGEYCGTDFVKITVLEGCEFPSYEYTNGSGAKKAFVQGVTVDYYDFSPSDVFSTNWAPVPDLGDTSVSSVDFDNTSGQLSFTLTSFDIPADGNETLHRECNLEEALNFYQKVWVDGIPLEDLIAENQLDVSSYITAKEGKGVFVLDLSGLTDISKVIIQKGAQIPAYNNTAVSVAEYNVFYFAAESDAMFVAQDGGFVKSDTVKWTVTFDGANPVEVEAGTKIPAEAFPAVEERSGFRHVWMHGSEEFDADTVVTENMNLTLEYIEVATITFDTDGGNEIAPVTVDKGVIASRPQDPVKEGFTFVGWYNGETEFDFTSPVNGNITLTARWEKEGGGCSAAMNMSGMSGIFFIVAVAAVAVSFLAKKHRAHKN